MLKIAFDEADLAPAWYLETGDVLVRCGLPDAKQRATWKMCDANARNGYRNDPACADFEATERAIEQGTYR